MQEIVHKLISDSYIAPSEIYTLQRHLIIKLMNSENCDIIKINREYFQVT